MENIGEKINDQFANQEQNQNLMQDQSPSKVEMHVVVDDPKAGLYPVLEEHKGQDVAVEQPQDVTEEDGSKRKTKRNSKYNNNINAPNTNKE